MTSTRTKDSSRTSVVRFTNEKMTSTTFLVPLRDLVARGYTRADELLRNYKTTWNHDLTRLFAEYNFL